MESYQHYIASSDNQTTQIETGKRPEPTSMVDAMAEVTSKKDLYDHLNLQLQLSFDVYND